MPFHKVKVRIILQLTLGNTSCKGNLKVNCKTLKDLLKFFYSGSCIQNGCSYDWCVGCGEQTSQCHSKGAYFSGRVESLDIFDDTELYSRFRFDREGIMMIIDLLDAELSHLTQQNHALPTSLQVFIALRCYASGSFQSVTGDTICVSTK